MPRSDLDAQNERTLAFFDEAQRQVLLKYAKAVKDVTTDLASQGTLRAPVRNGFLRASITDYPVELGMIGGRIIMSGKVAARQDYALIQHERADFNHPKGGEDHYLTKPLQERKGDYKAVLAAALTEAMKAAKGKL